MKETWVPMVCLPIKMWLHKLYHHQVPTVSEIQRIDTKNDGLFLTACISLQNLASFWGISLFSSYFRGVSRSGRREPTTTDQGRRLAIQMALTNPTRNTTTHEPASVPLKSPPWNATRLSWVFFLLGGALGGVMCFCVGGVVLGFMKTVKWDGNTMTIWWIFLSEIIFLPWICCWGCQILLGFSWVLLLKEKYRKRKKLQD